MIFLIFQVISKIFENFFPKNQNQFLTLTTFYLYLIYSDPKEKFFPNLFKIFVNFLFKFCHLLFVSCNIRADIAGLHQILRYQYKYCSDDIVWSNF